MLYQSSLFDCNEFIMIVTDLNKVLLTYIILKGGEILIFMCRCRSDEYPEEMNDPFLT